MAICADGRYRGFRSSNAATQLVADLETSANELRNRGAGRPVAMAALMRAGVGSAGMYGQEPKSKT